MAALFAAIERLSPSELWGVTGALRAGLYGTLVFGAVPAIVLGGPAYWLLRRSGHASLPATLSLGGVLGALVGVVEFSLVPWGVRCGIIASGITHQAAQRWLGSNRSSKPTPPRDAA